MEPISEYERKYLDGSMGVEGLMLLAYDIYRYPGEGYTVDNHMQPLIDRFPPGSADENDGARLANQLERLRKRYEALGKA